MCGFFISIRIKYQQVTMIYKTLFNWAMVSSITSYCTIILQSCWESFCLSNTSSLFLSLHFCTFYSLRNQNAFSETYTSLVAFFFSLQISCHLLREVFLGHYSSVITFPSPSFLSLLYFFSSEIIVLSLPVHCLIVGHLYTWIVERSNLIHCSIFRA